MGTDPYWAIGLSRNPFIAESLPEVPAALWIDRGFSAAPLVQTQRLVQILGEKGAGKTSHLKHWQQQAPGPYCYYPDGMARWKLPPVAAIAYWDEANRIPLPLLLQRFWQARQQQATIVAGTHADLSRWARLMGLTVQTIFLPALDVDALMAWAHLRIGAVRRSDLNPPQLVLSREQAAKIVAIAGSSWREAAVHLHIWAANAANAQRQMDSAGF